MIGKYPGELDSFTGSFTWSFDGQGTCWYEGQPKAVDGPADSSVPKCSDADAKAYPLNPDASGRFQWGWNGERSCYYPN
jgi:hypothetical protein